MTILAATSDLFASGALDGLNVVITAGPTREALDPVRYISNHSSGKMGYAVATAAAEAGARVVMISGPTRFSPPERVRTLHVETALEMAAAVDSVVAEADIFIATAAVADYRPADVAQEKRKRDGAPMTIELVPNPDILAAVAARPEPPFTVGFAAETESVEAHALAKLEAKRIDMIAANRVGEPGLGFNSDDNALHVFWRGGERQLARAPKPRLARELIALVAEIRAQSAD